jgi:hypothetical protein
MCLAVVLVVVVVFDATSLLPAVAPVDHGILPHLDGNTRRRDGDHGGGIPRTACGGTANVGGSSGCGGGGDSKRRTMRPLSPFSSLEALAKESIQKKEKADKDKFYFYLEEPLRVASPTRNNVPGGTRQGAASTTRINLEEPVRVRPAQPG